VIDWERREKEYKEKYPNDFKIKTIKRKKKLNILYKEIPRQKNLCKI